MNKHIDKNRNKNYIAIRLLAVVGVFLFVVLASSMAHAAGWVKDENDNWRFQKADGSYAKNSIQLSHGKRFYLNDEGYIEKNFFLQDYKNKSYYFDSEGVMVKNEKVQITPDTKSNKEIKQKTVIVLGEDGRVIREEEPKSNTIIRDPIVGIGLDDDGNVITKGESVPEEEGIIVDLWSDAANTKKSILRLDTIGDTVSFGSYHVKYPDGFEGEEKIYWTIVSKTNGYYLVSQNVFDSLGYQHKYKTDEYYNSNLRNWLLNDFYENSFDEPEKMLITSIVPGSDLISILDEQQYNKYIMNDKPFNNEVHIILHVDTQ